MQLLIKIIAGMTFAGACAWVWVEPNKFDGWIAAGASLAVFAALFVVDRRRKFRAALVQEQQVGTGGIGIQAGRDVTVGKGK